MNPLTGFLPLLLLSSCTVGPDYTAPDAPAQGRFRSKAAGALAAPASEGELASWWRRLGDARLNGLVEQAIAGNRDIKSAVASIKSVRALRNAARFDAAPIVTAGAGYTNARAPRSGVLPGAPRDSESYDIGFDATWELDLFGRVRRNVEAAAADLAAAEAVRDDLLVSVTAETARAYMELCGLHYQLRVAKENAANQRSSLDITTRLLEGGRGTGLDVSRAQAQYSTTLATIPQIEAGADKACHRLAVLTGQTPDTLRDRLGPATLPAKFPSIRLGDPSSLLRRRPDIRAAERQLAAATARIGVATADLFPRITFNGSIGSTAGSLRGIGNSGSGNFRFGPNINWAFLDTARRRQLVEAAGARAEARVAVYEQTVLLAFEDVENALTDYGREQTRRGDLVTAVRASADAASLARQRFEQGAAGFLEVLDAERVKLQAEAALAESDTRRATDFIAVFKALGGGWKS